MHNSMAVKIAVLLLTVYSIVLHELAHAYTAFRLGDPTAARQGRLTLNPVKHIDPFWTILLPLVTWVSSRGAFIFGGAKPVPVNPFLFKKPRQGMLITGAAGPLTNIALAAFFPILLRVPLFAPLGGFTYYVFVGVMRMNVYLAAFNLLPVPPLDGSRIVAGLLPRRLAEQYERLERLGFLPLLLIFITGIHWPVVLFIKGLIEKVLGF